MHHNYKHFFKSLLFAFSILATVHVIAQKPITTKGISVPTKHIEVANYISFYQPVTDKNNEITEHNKGYENDPELGTSFSNTPSNCYELIAKRTEKTKTFIRKGTNGSEYVMLGSADPLNYKDATGKWRTIHNTLRPDNTPGVYSVSERLVPVSFNTNTGFTSIGIKGSPYNVSYNNALELVYVKKDGTEQSLGAASWKSYTAGDDGVYVKNAWPGIDIEMRLITTGVKTNFIVNQAMPQYANGKLVIRDHLQFSDGLSMRVADNRLQIINGSEEEIFNASQAVAFEKGQVTKTFRKLDYRTAGNTLDIIMPGDFLDRQASSYPVIIDPVFSASGGGIVPNNGSSFDGGLPNNVTVYGCSVTIPVIMPAAVTLTDIQCTASKASAAGIDAHNSAFAFYNTLTNCWVWFHVASTDIGPEADGVTNFSLYPYFCEPPAPSCDTYTVNTLYWLSRGMADSLGACNATDIYQYVSPSVTLIGHTVEINTAPSATPPAICFGSCTVLSVTPQYGVPPYTYVWTPIASTSASLTVCPTVATTYSVTATDQCTNTATGSVTVTVNPLPPIPTITPGGPTTFCQGNSVLLTGSALAGGAYQWYNGLNLLSGATAQTFTATAAGTYYLTETYTATGCSTQSTGTTISINPLPLAVISPSTDSICFGTSASVTATPDITGNALIFTGVNGQYATIPKNTATNMQTSNFTVSAWVNTSSTNQQNILYNGTGCSQWGSWYLAIGGAENVTFANQVGFGFRTANASATTFVAAPGTVPLNTWMNVTTTYDGSTLKLYLNGSLSATATATGQPFSGNTPLYIGQDPGCGGRNMMNGMVDDIQIWNITRSATDIAATYNKLIPPSSTGLVAYYRFDEATGSTVYDLTSNANDGTKTNATTRQIPSTAPIVNASNNALTYLWSPATGIAPVTSSSVTVNPTVTTRYILTITNTVTGCANTSATNVDVLPLPTNVITANGPTTFCQGTLLSINTTTNSAYQWYLNDTALTGASTGQYFTVLQSGSYTVWAKGANGCTDTSAPLVITATPLPPITASSNTPICNGTTLLLNSSTTQSPVTYSWAGPGAITNSTSNNTSVLNAQSANSGVYTVTVTNTVTTCKNIATIPVVINALPTIILGANPTICLGASNAALSFSNNLPNTVTTTYNYNGVPQTFVVPPGITSVIADVQGANGANPPSGGGFGGKGGRVQGTIPVTPGEVLTLYVGGINSYNGGGAAGQLNGNAYSANGGGASDIRINSATLNDRIMVAGGGGGGASFDNNTIGGAGGNTTGGAAQYLGDTPVAQGGTQTAGGIGGNYTAVANSQGQNGSLGFGGAGGDPESGAGGGGGYYGGGGGAADGGGGGSSYVDPSITGVTMTQGYNNSDGSISLAITASNTYTIVWSSSAISAGFSNITNAALSGTATAINLAVPATAIATVYTGTLTVSNGTCTSSQYPISLTIYALPPVTISDNSPLCANNTLQLNSGSTQSPVTYAWNGPAAITNSTSGTATVPNAQPANNGTYTVTVTNTGTTCTNTGTVAATVNPLPPIIISDNSPICANNTLQLNSSTTQIPVSYSWGGPAAITNATNNNATVANAQAVNSGTYTVTITNTTTTCSNTATVAATINALPPIVISSNSPICATGQSLLLNSSTTQIPVTYVWSGPVTITNSTNSNATVNNAQAANTGTYTVTVTNTITACSNTATVAATINALPPITISSNSPICATGTTLQLNSSTTQIPVSYSWAGPATIVNPTNGNATVPNATSANSGTYTVTVTNTVTGCSNIATVAVTINSLPQITISTNSPICATGQSLLLNSSANQTTVTYAWTGPGVITNAASNNTTVLNAQAGNSGTYSVTVTNTVTGCTNTAATIATVNALPFITISSNSPICASGLTLELTSITPQSPVTYAWAGPATLTNATTSNPTVPNAIPANSGTYTVTITNTATTCSNTATISVTVNPLPPITISDNTPVCANGTLHLNSSTTQIPVTYAWTGPATITNAASNNATVTNAQPTNSGTYTVTITNTVTTCSNTATVPADILALPPVLIGSNSPICANNNLEFNSSTTQSPVTYAWTGPATITTSTSADASVLNAQFSNSGVYTVTVTNTSTTCSNIATVQATVNALPPITISDNTPMCSGVTLLLNSSTIQSPVSYSWDGPATITNAANNNATVSNTLPVNSGIYTVTVTNTSTGCSNTATVSATVNAYPASSITTSGPTTFCDGSNIVLTANTDIGNTYAWYNGTTQVGSASTYTATTSGTYTVLITNTNGTTNCGTTSAPVVITVKTMPVVPVVQNNGPLCAGATLQLTSASTTSGVNYNWYGPNSFTCENQDTTIANAQPLSSGIYSVTATLNGCTSQPGTTTVNVYAIPPAPVAASNSQICPNTTLQLSATDSFANGSYSWAGPLGFNSNAQFPTIPNAPATASGIYTVTVTVNGCTSPASQTTVVIAPYIAQLSISKDTLCTDMPATLTFNGTISSNINYAWNFGDATVLSGNSYGPYSLQWDSAGTKIINVTASYNGCSASASDTVIVNSYVYLNPTMAKDVCVDQVIVFNTAYNSPPPVGWAWQWDFDGATVLNGSSSQGPFEFEWPTPGIKVVKLVYSGDICLMIPNDTVNVHDVPTAKIVSTTNTNICTGDTVVFNAQYVPGCKYTWTPAEYFAGQLTDNKVTGIIYQPGNIVLTVTNQYGCAAMDSVNINAQVCCDMDFPTAFSPNGDGLNDYFGPINFGHHAITSFKIVNRWGQTVFSSNDGTKKWDGTFNGVPQDLNTYYWYIKYKCSDGSYSEKSGEVVLMR